MFILSGDLFDLIIIEFEENKFDPYNSFHYKGSCEMENLEFINMMERYFQFLTKIMSTISISECHRPFFDKEEDAEKALDWLESRVLIEKLAKKIKE